MEAQYTEEQIRDAFKDVDENTKNGENPHGEYRINLDKYGKLVMVRHVATFTRN